MFRIAALAALAMVASAMRGHKGHGKHGKGAHIAKKGYAAHYGSAGPIA